MTDKAALLKGVKDIEKFLNNPYIQQDIQLETLKNEIRYNLDLGTDTNNIRKLVVNFIISEQFGEYLRVKEYLEICRLFEDVLNIEGLDLQLKIIKEWIDNDSCISYKDYKKSNVYVELLEFATGLDTDKVLDLLYKWRDFYKRCDLMG